MSQYNFDNFFFLFDGYIPILTYSIIVLLFIFYFNAGHVFRLFILIFFYSLIKPWVTYYQFIITILIFCKKSYL